MPLPTMRTASEFIDYYYSQLRSKFSSNNFKLSKTGFIGFILDVLGNTQYDIKQYYDGLFAEAFPATASDNTNLEYHSDLHGYIRSFAKASIITDGSLTFNLSTLPVINAGLTSRIITLGSSSAVVGSTLPLGIILNGKQYTIDSVYNLKAKIIGGSIVSYDTEIISPGSQKNISLSLNSTVLPIVAGNQYYPKSTIYNIPYYIPGTHYQISIPLSSTNMVSSMTITVFNSNTRISKIFPTSTNKSKYTSVSDVVFFSLSTNNTIVLELGSGVLGTYIPSGSTVTVSMNLTDGVAGNILPSSNLKSSMITSNGFSRTAIVTDTYPTGVISSVITIADLISPTISTSTGGSDISTGVKLRDELMTYIQSSDYLISELDYNNYLKKVYSEYYVTFSKQLLSVNTIYAYLPLFNKYGIPYKTTTVAIDKQLFETVKYSHPSNGSSSIFHPSSTVNGTTMVSPFYYKYDPLFRAYRGYDVPVTTTSYYSNVQVTDAGGIAIVNSISYIDLTTTYNHNSISPFTIITIGSYEDLTAFTTTPATTTLSIATPNVSLISNTPSHILPVSKKSGITTTTSIVIGVADTVIPVVSVTAFSVIGTILIGTEEITYTGKDIANNTFIGCTRGANATIAATHIISSTVDDLTINTSKIDFIFGVISSQLSASILITDTTIPLLSTIYFPVSGSIYIGSEEMTYTGKTATSLIGVTRGANATVASSHTINTAVYEQSTTAMAVLNPDMYFGILPQSTSITVTLDTISGTVGSKSIYSFVTTQMTNISDFLLIKEFSTIGLQSSLSGTITNIDTIIPVTSTSPFSATGGYAKISNEYIYYTGTSLLTLIGVVRGVNTSTPTSHPTGVSISSISIVDLNVPFVDSITYSADSAFIDTQVHTNITSLTIPTNRSLSDEIQVRLLDTSSISLADIRNIVYNGSTYTAGISLPLKVNITLLINNQILISSGSVLSSDLLQLKDVIASALLSQYTGVKIRVSDADLVLLCKVYSYVDDANVSFTDSSVVPVAIPSNEINVKPDAMILSGMTKDERMAYVPPLWYWDVNNISITYTVQ